MAQTPPDGAVLDAGCGTGADLGTLLRAVPQGRVTGIEIEPLYAARARARFPRAEVIEGDMLALAPDGLDLIWSTGTLCGVGVTHALESWRARLKPSGRVVFSDLRARVPDPPAEVVDFWREAGVALTGVEALAAEVASAGYRILDARWLGTPGWTSYYSPLEVALDEVAPQTDKVIRLRAEIAMWRTHGVSYGCRIVVCAPDPDA